MTQKNVNGPDLQTPSIFPYVRDFELQNYKIGIRYTMINFASEFITQMHANILDHTSFRFSKIQIL